MVVCKIEHVKAQVAERVACLFGRVEGGISADFTLSTADQRFDIDIGNIGIPDYRRNVFINGSKIIIRIAQSVENRRFALFLRRRGSTRRNRSRDG